MYLEKLYKHEKINHILIRYSFFKYKKKCNALAIVRNILGGIRKMILYRVEKKKYRFLDSRHVFVNFFVGSIKHISFFVDGK